MIKLYAWKYTQELARYIPKTTNHGSSSSSSYPCSSRVLHVHAEIETFHCVVALRLLLN
ncbi:hypothetical protein PLEOSDRAFT_1090561 [Pleurotus ostreatus PC15]|uniref:Uncharacterized protein n=1 Tax=Pleurotus ostreatus (strain PC15) TaxID=1137138 RepID=A0A067N6H7_PLEO1|nr:hypothetical protein PLEOSDRAFT_1090561 [Pleurotus ostreatus PC15]